jgi:hypothetical protein
MAGSGGRQRGLPTMAGSDGRQRRPAAMAGSDGRQRCSEGGWRRCGR